MRWATLMLAAVLLTSAPNALKTALVAILLATVAEACVFALFNDWSWTRWRVSAYVAVAAQVMLTPFL